MTAAVSVRAEHGGPRPVYAVGAVDHALITIEILAQRPSLRLTELAVELQIGRATAHRLLQMMLYRGFAVQNSDRSYAAGPMLAEQRRFDNVRDLGRLRTCLRPQLEGLARTLGETVQLCVLDGIESVCVDIIPGSKPLHIVSARDDRRPAEHVSGGLSLLSHLPALELRRRYAGRPASSMAGFEHSLATTRRRGFGLIVGEGRAGVTSVAAVVCGADRRAVAAIACSAPTMRLGRAQTVAVAAIVQAAVHAAEDALA